jgi:hypothetical protein
MNKKAVRATFRNEVFKRDKYKCKCCGKDGYDRQGTPVENKIPLDAHHIQDRHGIENGGYTKFNGISVCDECHLKAEKYHITEGKEWEEGFHPDDLYKLIDSSLEKAIQFSKKL